MNSKNDLKNMLNRLKKAYGMPPQQQKKWQVQIEELEILVAALGNKNEGDLVVQAMEHKYMLMNQKLSMELMRLGQDGKVDSFFTENPEASSLISEACDGIERAFELRSMDILDLKLQLYAETFLKLMRIFEHTGNQCFRELTGREQQQIHMDLVKVGWR